MRVYRRDLFFTLDFSILLTLNRDFIQDNKIINLYFVELYNIEIIISKFELLRFHDYNLIIINFQKD